MYQVTKRDGKVAPFDLSKISEAIRKAFEAKEKEYHQDIIDLLALKVTADFEPKIKKGLVSVEDIQDSVESMLIRAGYADVAKGYILYRKQREKKLWVNRKSIRGVYGMRERIREIIKRNTRNFSRRNMRTRFQR